MRSFNFYTRKTHRYLGLVIGIQFLLWTIGGVFFSWTDIREIRGEHLMNQSQAPITLENFSVSPSEAAESIRSAGGANEIVSIRAVELLGEPFYEVVFGDGEANHSALVSAADGKIRPPITENEARRLAARAVLPDSEIAKLELITPRELGAHHEYREKPLPAWAVEFAEPSGLTVYVAAATGRVEAFRTNNWRIYDFLWMLHTMGYENRDNFNNYFLRGFALFGFVTVISGFALFLITSRTLRRILRRG